MYFEIGLKMIEMQTKSGFGLFKNFLIYNILYLSKSNIISFIKIAIITKP